MKKSFPIVYKFSTQKCRVYKSRLNITVTVKSLLASNVGSSRRGLSSGAADIKQYWPYILLVWSPTKPSCFHLI